MTKEKRRLFILVLIGCLIIIFIGRHVVLRMQRHLKSMQAEIEARVEAWSAAEQEIIENEIYLEKWDKIRGFLDQVLEDQQNEFTAYLQRLAPYPDFFTDLGSPDATPMADNPEFQVLRCKLSFSVDLPALVEFLASLDTSERLLRIERLDINRKEVLRPTYGYPGRSYEMDLPSSRTEVLSVTMTIATPASAAVEPTVVEELP